MKKTSVYLEADLDDAVARAAAERGISKAELIRQTLRASVQTARPRLTAIAVGAGPGDVAGDVDRHLRETGFGT